MAYGVKADWTLLYPSMQGKPLAESRGELAYSNSFIEWFAEEGMAETIVDAFVGQAKCRRKRIEGERERR